MFVSGKVIIGDNRETLKSLPDGSVQSVITSPPYWGLRDYGNDNQIGLESTPAEYVEQLCLVFDEVWRVLADDGTVWVNLGDSYFEKSLAGAPWLFAFAMKARGWYLRQDIIWAKPNPMPESVTDRCTKSHEYIFLLSKSANYYFDHLAIREPATTSNVEGVRFGGSKYGDSDDPLHATKSGNVYVEDGFRNKRDVWFVTTSRYADAHFATYNPELIKSCILAGSREGDLILDPFSGSGTTGVVAMQNGRNYVGTELNPEYAQMSLKRINESIGMFGDVELIK